MLTDAFMIIPNLYNVVIMVISVINLGQGSGCDAAHVGNAARVLKAIPTDPHIPFRRNFL